jgi:hypothetical protein
MLWQSAIGGFTKEVIFDNTKKWKGDHLVDPEFVPGVLFSNIKLNQETLSLIDIFPSVLSSLGLAQEMEGRTLLE